MTAAAGAGLGAAEREALLVPCECGHTINDHGSLANCWTCGDEGGDCAHTFEDLLVERVAKIVSDRLAAADRDAGLRAKVAELCDLAETQVSMSMAVTIDGSPMFRAQVSAEALRAALDAS